MVKSIKSRHFIMSNSSFIDLELVLINIIKCLYFFDLTTFQTFGQKFLQFVCCIFRKFQTPSFYSEITRPLVHTQLHICRHCASQLFSITSIMKLSQYSLWYLVLFICYIGTYFEQNSIEIAYKMTNQTKIEVAKKNLTHA